MSCEHYRKEFLCIDNGPLHTETITHYCGSECACRDRTHTVQRLVFVWIRWVLGRRPPIPQLTEFTAIARAGRTIGFLAACHRVVAQAFDIMVGTMKPRAELVPQLVANPAPTLNQTESSEPKVQEWFDQCNWHALQGARKQQVSEHLTTRSGLFHAIFISYFSVVTEIVSDFLTARSSAAAVPRHVTPVLYELCSEKRIPYFVALQWMSTILTPDSKVFMFLVLNMPQVSKCLSHV